jgi:hypothetical protein
VFLQFTKGYHKLWASFPSLNHCTALHCNALHCWKSCLSAIYICSGLTGGPVYSCSWSVQGNYSTCSTQPSPAKSQPSPGKEDMKPAGACRGCGYNLVVSSSSLCVTPCNSQTRRNRGYSKSITSKQYINQYIGRASLSSSFHIKFSRPGPAGREGMEPPAAGSQISHLAPKIYIQPASLLPLLPLLPMLPILHMLLCCPLMPILPIFAQFLPCCPLTQKPCP